jgi:hypothetical protein
MVASFGGFERAVDVHQTREGGLRVLVSSKNLSEMAGQTRLSQL